MAIDDDLECAVGQGTIASIDKDEFILKVKGHEVGRAECLVLICDLKGYIRHVTY